MTIETKNIVQSKFDGNWNMLLALSLFQRRQTRCSQSSRRIIFLPCGLGLCQPLLLVDIGLHNVSPCGRRQFARIASSTATILSLQGVQIDEPGVILDALPLCVFSYASDATCAEPQSCRGHRRPGASRARRFHLVDYAVRAAYHAVNVFLSAHSCGFHLLWSPAGGECARRRPRRTRRSPARR